MRFPVPSSLAFLLLVLFLPSIARPQERDLQAEREVERKCLECHNNPALHGARADGKLRSAYVDTERYRNSVHYEKEYTCLSCHPDATPDFHPREGVRIRSCGDCHDHEDELADFQKSRHGKALKEGVKDGADCFSCHSNHYTRKKSDPEARIHPDRVRETCGACHPEEGGFTASGSWWAGSRMSAHGKSDLSGDFSVRNCRDCHFGPDTHRTPLPEELPVCAACHTHSAEEAPTLPSIVGPVHLASGENHGEALGVLRGAGLVVSVIGFLVLAVPAAILGFRLRGSRKVPKEDAGGE